MCTTWASWALFGGFWVVVIHTFGVQVRDHLAASAPLERRNEDGSLTTFSPKGFAEGPITKALDPPTRSPKP